MRLYWPPGPNGNPTRAPLNKHERKTNPEHAFKQTLVSWSRKSEVHSAKFLREDGTHEHVAVKSVPLEAEHEKRVLEEFRQLADLDHCHIIAALGVFIEDQIPGSARIGILLFPLAPLNMEQYLYMISDHNRACKPGIEWRMFHDMKVFVSYFACLCQAVIYLHDLDNPIKHRDIKPENILIHGGTVILADFDIAKQYTNRELAYTEGPTHSTPRYAPQNVKDEEPRGLEWDVVCLGFVFLEMASVMMGETMQDLIAALENKYYSDALSSRLIHGWLKKLKLKATEQDNTQWPRDCFMPHEKKATDEILMAKADRVRRRFCLRPGSAFLVFVRRTAATATLEEQM
ncbi:hypothetical protein M409DRAFT_25589 [Zasmidium cellare ATCC 36951]|uniref:Protein kinase domain-containing protein n=1 Tax=Zasmidium cellare ATCC 36951 TaxID=1080233 RepID=A0A6A6CB36_ZASCE|nr:uncharacterized protein M409DRAFT_25589 [Zasmidium cellare ATCC 36951]KAF2164245.1 hypothetical protein M409DRAFT_25589 [Zasmidium cellare ATCC 36951]